MLLRQLAFPLAAVLLAVVLATWIHGGLTDRWGMDRPAELEQFAARLARVPKVFGTWEGSEAPVDPRQLQAARVAGHVSRSYRHRQSGQVVHLFLVCGTSRHITLHTPNLCYTAAGYESEGPPQSFLADAGLALPVEWATSLFYKEEPTGLAQMRIFWTFSGDGKWHGPRYARTSLAGKGALYKLYLIAPIAAGQSRVADESPALAFARDAMPQLQAILFPPAPQARFGAGSGDFRRTARRGAAGVSGHFPRI